jgi:hypothetical protein
MKTYFIGARCTKKTMTEIMCKKIIKPNAGSNHILRLASKKKYQITLELHDKTLEFYLVTQEGLDYLLNPENIKLIREKHDPKWQPFVYTEIRKLNEKIAEINEKHPLETRKFHPYRNDMLEAFMTVIHKVE